MTVTPSSNDLERMTPKDARNANLIALLLLCAKTLQCTTVNLRPDATDAQRDVTGKALASFVYQLALNHGDGKDLEADALALAKQLGFNIEQRYLSQEAHA